MLVDTCQASSLLQPLADAQSPSGTIPAVVPGPAGVAGPAGTSAAPAAPAAPAAGPIVGLASSALGENSYSLEIDPRIGAALSDRFTFFTHRFLASLMPEASPGPTSQLHVLQRTLSWSRELTAGFQLKEHQGPLQTRGARCTVTQRWRCCVASPSLYSYAFFT